MKKSLSVLICILMFHLNGQKLEKSSSFPTPEGKTHLIHLKNGNAFLMEITRRDGIKVMLFDTIHKKSASGKLALKILEDKIGHYLFEGLFEINGDPTFFVQVAEGRVPVLIRVVVDGKTGKVKSEEKAAELDKWKAGAGYAALFADVDIPDFQVVKDPESDFYAIVRYNSMAEETKNRIEVLHYNPSHKLINKANFTGNNTFKYTRYLNVYVNKDNYVVLATYSFNTDKTGGDEGRFHVSQLSKGKSSFKQQELSYKDFYKNVRCTFEYNKVKQLLHMVLVTNVSFKGNSTLYEYHFQNVNPTTLKVDKQYSPDFTKVNEYYMDKMGKKKEFAGTLAKTSIDRNGNIILYFQEKTVVTKGQGGGAITHVYYGDVALLTVTPEGKTVGSAVFPASVTGENGAFDITMVAGESNTYIFFNNSVDNMNKPEDDEPRTVKALGVCVPVKYTYANNSVKKDYLFKEPKEKKGNPYCDFSVTTYDPVKRKFTALYIDPEKDKASLVWVGLN